MSDELVTWLRAVLDQDAEMLRALDSTALNGIESTAGGGVHGYVKRGLADVEAKRRILDEHAPLVLTYWPTAMCGTCGDRDAEVIPHPLTGGQPWWPNANYPCLTVRLLASAYATWLGYQESWRA